jgi:enoyl-CoA hydratase/carnithine racemase
MTNEIELENRDGILLVTMNRPERRNAMTSTMLARLRDLFTGVGADESVRIVVVRGAGAAFSSGLDLAEMEAAKQSSGSVGLTAIEDVFRALEVVPQPTIALVAGVAIAGGCELALHCDLRVAATTARFSMPLAKLGLVLPFPLVQKLVERIGTAFTNEILFTGEPFDGARAYELGMVNRLVAPEDLDRVGLELAAGIAANAPLSLRAMKRAILRTRANDKTIDVRDLLDEARRVGASEDVAEGVRAMREKRKPVFRGR